MDVDEPLFVNKFDKDFLTILLLQCLQCLSCLCSAMNLSNKIHGNQLFTVLQIMAEVMIIFSNVSMNIVNEYRTRDNLAELKILTEI